MAKVAQGARASKRAKGIVGSLDPTTRWALRCPMTLGGGPRRRVVSRDVMQFAGTRLALLRIDAGLSRKELAGKLRKVGRRSCAGITPAQLKAWEGFDADSTNSSEPSATQFLALCAVLRVSAEDLCWSSAEAERSYEMRAFGKGGWLAWKGGELPFGPHEILNMPLEMREEARRGRAPEGLAEWQEILRDEADLAEGRRKAEERDRERRWAAPTNWERMVSQWRRLVARRRGEAKAKGGSR